MADSINSSSLLPLICTVDYTAVLYSIQNIWCLRFYPTFPFLFEMCTSNSNASKFCFSMRVKSQKLNNTTRKMPKVFFFLLLLPGENEQAHTNSEFRSKYHKTICSLIEREALFNSLSFVLFCFTLSYLFTSTKTLRRQRKRLLETYRQIELGHEPQTELKFFWVTLF